MGEWAQNKKNGYGVFYYHTGAIYEGQFVDDLRHGQGKITFLKGSPVEESYEGSWENDEWHGYGVYRYRKEEGEGLFIAACGFGREGCYFAAYCISFDLWIALTTAVTPFSHLSHRYCLRR